MHDIKPKGTWHKIKIKDRTKNKYGLPSSLAMERRLAKAVRD